MLLGEPSAALSKNEKLTVVLSPKDAASKQASKQEKEEGVKVGIYPWNREMIRLKLEARCLGGHFLVTVKKESRGGRVLPTITDGARQKKSILGIELDPVDESGVLWS